MTSEPRRGVTRGYVAALVGAAVIVACALLVAVWGGFALLFDREPVTSSAVPTWTAPVILLAGLGLLAVMLWRQAITLLRGRRAPSWSSIVVLAVSIYLWWGIAGILGGMTLGETWQSPFAAALPPIWAASALLFWAVLSRRVYTDRPPPRWPWERHSEEEE